MSSESHDTDPATGAAIDPDEDLFDFQAVPQGDWSEEEDLDAVFAQFELEEARFGQDLPDAGDEPEDDGTLPGEEDFAGLNPDPPAPLPRREKAVGAPPVRSPDPQELTHVEARDAERPATDGDAPDEPAGSAREQARAQVAARVVARHPVTQPAAAPADDVRPRGGIGVRTAAWILVTITSLNVLVALVALRSDRDLRRTIDGMGEEFARSASELVEGALRASQAPGASSGAGRDALPIVPPNPDNHPTFELARAEMQRGEYARARQRVYALLAIVDRLDPRVREDVEARAGFLIARSLHHEALERLEAGR